MSDLNPANTEIFEELNKCCIQSCTQANTAK